VKFFKHLEAHHPDLVRDFDEKIYFLPDGVNPDTLYAAFTPLEDFPEFKEKRENMLSAFDAFCRENPV